MASKKLLIHRHEYGTSIAVCILEGFKDEDLLMTEEQSIKVAKLCGLDFEPEKNEELEIVDLDETTTFITREQIYGN